MGEAAADNLQGLVDGESVLEPGCQGGVDCGRVADEGTEAVMLADGPLRLWRCGVLDGGCGEVGGKDECGIDAGGDGA